jgi:hypothetical protein
MILLFLLSLKYNVLHSKNLHNDEIQHCACLYIFSEFFEMLNFEFMKRLKGKKNNRAH